MSTPSINNLRIKNENYENKMINHFSHTRNLPNNNTKGSITMKIYIRNIKVHSISNIGSLNIGKTVLSHNQAKAVSYEIPSTAPDPEDTPPVDPDVTGPIVTGPISPSPSPTP